MKNNIYEFINICNVISKLNLKITHQTGSNIYLNCPFCQNRDEKNGYMKINITNNLYICNNCEARGTSIDLYAKAKFISTKEAFKKLLKEPPVLNNISYVYNNPIKDEYYRDLVYRSFLDMQQLSKQHKIILSNMGFSNNYILDNQFKSIENRANKKKEICRKLQEQGLNLDGISRLLSRYRF